MRRTNVWWIAVVVAGLGFPLAGCGGSDESDEPADLAPMAAGPASAPAPAPPPQPPPAPAGAGRGRGASRPMPRRRRSPRPATPVPKQGKAAKTPDTVATDDLLALAKSAPVASPYASSSQADQGATGNGLGITRRVRRDGHARGVRGPGRLPGRRRTSWPGTRRTLRRMRHDGGGRQHMASRGGPARGDGACRATPARAVGPEAVTKKPDFTQPDQGRRDVPRGRRGQGHPTALRIHRRCMPPRRPRPKLRPIFDKMRWVPRALMPSWSTRSTMSVHGMKVMGQTPSAARLGSASSSVVKKRAATGSPAPSRCVARRAAGWSTTSAAPGPSRPLTCGTATRTSKAAVIRVPATPRAITDAGAQEPPCPENAFPTNISDRRYGERVALPGFPFEPRGSRD